jgi:hypothetical protein
MPVVYIQDFPNCSENRCDLPCMPETESIRHDESRTTVGVLANIASSQAGKGQKLLWVGGPMLELYKTVFESLGFEAHATCSSHSECVVRPTLALCLCRGAYDKIGRTSNPHFLANVSNFAQKCQIPTQ